MADIVICAENPVTRAGLAAMAAAGSNSVLAQLGSVPALSIWLRTQSANLAVVELSKLGESELAGLTELTNDLLYGESPEQTMPLLFLLDDLREPDREPDRKSVRKLVADLLNTGLVSVLPMTVSANQMRDAIAAILNGLVILHPDLTDILFTVSAPYFAAIESVADTVLEPLTAREIQVLNQLASGLTNKAIAKACNISEHTVKFHISAIFSKLGVSSRTEAVAVSIRQGLVML